MLQGSSKWMSDVAVSGTGFQTGLWRQFSLIPVWSDASILTEENYSRYCDRRFFTVSGFSTFQSVDLRIINLTSTYFANGFPMHTISRYCAWGPGPKHPNVKDATSCKIRPFDLDYFQNSKILSMGVWRLYLLVVA